TARRRVSTPGDESLFLQRRRERDPLSVGEEISRSGPNCQGRKRVFPHHTGVSIGTLGRASYKLATSAWRPHESAHERAIAGVRRTLTAAHTPTSPRETARTRASSSLPT